MGNSVNMLQCEDAAADVCLGITIEIQQLLPTSGKNTINTNNANTNTANTNTTNTNTINANITNSNTKYNKYKYNEHKYNKCNGYCCCW